MVSKASMQVVLVAGPIIGYFNMAVGVTVLVVESLHAFIAFGFKLYYNKKF